MKGEKYAKNFYSIFGCGFILVCFFLQAHDLYASVTEGKACDVKDGSYAVIINTNLQIQEIQERLFLMKILQQIPK